MNVKEFHKEVREQYEAIARFTIRAPWFRRLNIGLIIASMFWVGFYIAYHKSPQFMYKFMEALV